MKELENEQCLKQELCLYRYGPIQQLGNHTGRLPGNIAIYKIHSSE